MSAAQNSSQCPGEHSADIPDVRWAGIARITRQALGLLGYSIRDTCLPDEPDPCGAGFAAHAAAHLGAIKAVADHQLAHLGAGLAGVASQVYDGTAVDLAGCNPQGSPR